MRTAVLYTRRGCHLCEEAGALLDDLAPVYGLHVIRVDIDDDPALVDRYQFDVPVIEVDGAPVIAGHITEASLRDALARPA